MNEDFFNNYNGAFDNRTEEQKQKDWSQKEIVASSATVEWTRKKKEDFRSFPSLNQFYTNKCVAFTLRKLAGILYFLRTGQWLDFSASFPYEYRVNQDSGGMIGIDAFDIWMKKGMTLEPLCPSNHTYDSEKVNIDDFAKQVAQGFVLGGHIGIEPSDFDAICSTIQKTKKGIMLWYYFTNREWSLDVPRVRDNLSSPYVSGSLRHSVSGVDFGIASKIETVDGEQVIKIEDSAHFGGKDVRYITRDFHTKRCFLARYPMNFKFDGLVTVNPTKPNGVFTSDLEFSPAFKVDGNVIRLQDCLKYLKMFPSNVDSTGWYGSMTRTAVEQFQTTYNVAKKGDAGFGRFGPKTRAKMAEVMA